jgi:hypothetical protein
VLQAAAAQTLETVLTREHAVMAEEVFQDKDIRVVLVCVIM